MVIRIYFDDEKDGLIDMPFFSKWFTENDIIPSIGEKIFVPDDEEARFPKETENCGSGEWIVHSKHYEPDKDKIIIWCRDYNNGKPTF